MAARDPTGGTIASMPPRASSSHDGSRPATGGSGAAGGGGGKGKPADKPPPGIEDFSWERVGVGDDEIFHSDMKGPIYEDIDVENEYVSFAGKNLGLNKLFELFKTLETDESIKHVNFSYNVSSDEMRHPNQATRFYKELAVVFRNNKQLLAIDLAGNHLFEYSEHPTNEHLVNYVEVLADMLVKTNVKRLDLSDNCIVGPTGKMLKGMGKLMRNVMVKRGEALTVRFSSLTSQGWRAVSDGLGARSTMQYLDISDNQGGLDAGGRPNSEGVLAMCTQLSQCLKLHTFKAARNILLEKDCIMIANAIACLPQFLTLDLSGNDCHGLGAKAIADAIIAHGALQDIGKGIRDIYLSHNPLGTHGVINLCFALRRSLTVKQLGLADCNINDEAMDLLREALANNGSVTKIDVSRNPASENNQKLTRAEVEAMEIVHKLRTANHFRVIETFDANKLTLAVYSALAKKLRFLSKFELKKLHKNPSFIEPNTEMQLWLFKNEPPPRRTLFNEVKSVDETMDSRLEKSRVIQKKLDQANIIYRNVMVWWKKVKYELDIKKKLEEAQRKLAKLNAHNAEDDEYSKYNK